MDTSSTFLLGLYISYFTVLLLLHLSPHLTVCTLFNSKDYLSSFYKCCFNIVADDEQILAKFELSYVRYL